MANNTYISLVSAEDDIVSLSTPLTNVICNILFALGIIGNSLGLLIFSSSCRTWRTSPTYVCLATCSSIINLLCVIRFASVLHSSSRHILRQLIAHTWWACKIYEFSFSCRVISSWITLFWMFERLLCVSQGLRRLFNRWNSFQLKLIIPMLIMIIVVVCVVGPPVYMFEPKIIYRSEMMNTTTEMMRCKLHPNASVKWQRYFGELHLGMNHFTTRCLLSELFPAGVILLFNVCILHHLRVCRRFHRAHDDPRSKTQSNTISWMNKVLIVHSFLFLFSLFAHILGHFVAMEAHETWWIQFIVLINCSLNFYVYCLSGEAFRNKIRWFAQRIKTHLPYKVQIRQRRRERYCRNARDLNLIYEMKAFHHADRFM